MQFLDEAAQEMPTTSSLPRNICHDEDSASSLNDLEFQQCNFSNVSSPTDCSMSDIETASSSAHCRLTKKRKEKQYDLDSQSLHNNMLQLLTENTPKKDAVDNFLEQIGDVLRRLNYLRRRQTQMELLHLIHRAEDEELTEREITKR
ncbi:PREDICTED: uncharacterized protein LOC108773975 [Cyphomyrmex costatus]|uniref:uncharacterized protein LOC108773975 n=1 Tax=Cyphomyrmex costatus TaxID=456900 RepID=UPI0008522725|nr:PREDICTED: uncharacterized protein LOC108773975 [Cyphomyrmex costatus]